MSTFSNFKQTKNIQVEYYIQYTKYQSRIYFITFVSYGLLHLSRKCYVNLKVKLETDAHLDSTFLSVLLFIYELLLWIVYTFSL